MALARCSGAKAILFGSRIEMQFRKEIGAKDKNNFRPARSTGLHRFRSALAAHGVRFALAARLAYAALAFSLFLSV